MENGKRFAPRENVPLEQYDRTQLFAFQYLTRIFGAIKLAPPVLIAASANAITKKQVRCMTREYSNYGRVDYRPPFTLKPR